MMDPKRLRYFVMVAETLHFGRAAEALNIVQPALSQQVRLLEEELGVQLLERSSRKVVLTEPGRVLLVEGRSALRQLERAEEVVQMAATGTGGRLRIGFVDNAVWSNFPKVLHSFRELFPHVALELHQMDRTTQGNALRAREIDIGIMPDQIVQEGWHTEPVVSAPLAVALPHGHHLSKFDAIAIGRLAEDSFVLFPAMMKTRVGELTSALCATSGFIPKAVQEVGQLHAALSLVDAGLGVAVVPGWIAHAKLFGLTYRPILPKTDYVLVMVYQSDNDPPSIATFRDTLRSVAEPNI